LKLRGIPFHPVFDASGARNFDGHGWWYHRFLKPIGMDFKNSTFVAKTTTLHPRKGNMELEHGGFQPKKKFHDCIIVNFRKGFALNAVGLSGPGAKVLFEKKIWQDWPEPFFISFMPIAETDLERLSEMREFVELLQFYKRTFRSPFGLQINMSCPNVGKRAAGNFIEEVEGLLEIAETLNIPLMPKLSVTTDVATAVEIAKLKSCDALCVSNTIPWGQMSDRISWRELFGSDESPLKKYGGGGLSGAPLLPIVEDWVREATLHQKISKPINAGGGILSCQDMLRLKNVGASSIFLGSIAFLRGWRVKKIIQMAHEIFET
jgi:dihydroorotate dehydrogenase